jgi:hypothetical protein
MNKLNPVKVDQKIDMNAFFPGERHAEHINTKFKVSNNYGKGMILSFVGSKKVYALITNSSWKWYLKSSIELQEEVVTFDLDQGYNHEKELLVVDKKNTAYIINSKI